jgi:hypothetical protein
VVRLEATQAYATRYAVDLETDQLRLKIAEMRR